MSWSDIRDDLSLAEYLCLLSEAFDAEEIEDLKTHNLAVATAIAFHAPKKIKKWRWQTPDRAGTRSVGGQKEVAVGLAAMVLSVNKDVLKKGKLEASHPSLIMERAKATGRPLVWMDSNYNYFDKDGNPTERDKLALVIKMDNGHTN